MFTIRVCKVGMQVKKANRGQKMRTTWENIFGDYLAEIPGHGASHMRCGHGRSGQHGGGAGGADVSGTDVVPRGQHVHTRAKIRINWQRLH